MRVLYWVVGTAILLQLLACHSAALHDCIHEKISLDHFPKIQTKGDGLEKRFAAGFSPIRITPYFMEPLSSTFRSELTNQTGALARVLSLISRTLLVRRLSGNMTIPPTCDEYTYGTNVGKCRVLHTTTQCGPFTVPSQFIGTRQVCSSFYGSCRESGGNGTGAANTDLLLFVGTQDYCPSSGTLAFASSCAIDQWYRPSAGYLSLCTSNLIASTDAEHIPEVLFNLLLHEISHALGFSRSQFQYFHDGSLNFYRPDTTGYYAGSSITGLNSPKVLQLARNYFGCRDLPFVPLENSGSIDGVSSHWEARVLHHETMAPFLSNDYAVFSNFTLAFFEDSGWYQVNYTSINNFDQFELQWGRGLGCDFVLESCNNPSTYPYLCNTAVLHQCTFDHISKGSCKRDHTHFDGCPVVVADDDTACVHRINTPVPNSKNEVYGAGSICVEVNTTLGDCLPLGGTPRCYQRQVVQQTTTDELAFALNVNGSTYWCRNSEVLNTSDGLIFCPSRDEILLRISTGEISPLENLPLPENVIEASSLEYSGSGLDILTNNSVLQVCSAPEQQACNNGDVRLVGGSTPYEGRVEVCRNDEWGTVCDNGWGTADAQVVCRQLGFETAGARAYSYAYFGRGSGSIYMTYVGCTGRETRLLSCRYSSPYSYYYYRCSHSEDAGVRCPGPCQHGSVRVVSRYGVILNRGNVQMCISGRWRTVCANSWDNRDASVVCRQLGYSPHGAVAQEDIYQPTSHRFVNTGLNCSGMESKLTNCTQNLDEAYSCQSFGTAWVSCQRGILPNASCNDGAVRLRNGYLPGEGRVEVCINNAWGTVCDDGWDNADASVVCRELGYYPIGNATRSAFFSQGRGPIFMEYVRCSGFEETLLDCKHNGLGYSTCGHYEDAGVVCQVGPQGGLTANCTLGEIRLVNGASELDGRVEVCFGNLWGTICHNSWDNRDAGVICKQLFGPSFGGYAINGSRFGSGRMPTVVHNMNCNGTEENLMACSITSFTTSNCRDSTVAGIECYEFQEEENVTCSDGDIRLTDGRTDFEGKVEICYDNHWGAMCGSSWDANEANVVCRQLGHIAIGATAFSNSYFGIGFRPQFMQVISCLGSESSVLACSHTPLGSNPSCNETGEVGVRCIDPSNACTPGDVRLVGGTNQYQGRVEVCFYGIWGTVCDRSFTWSTVDANVVCRQLGFSSLGAISHRYAYYGRGSGPIFMDYVYCRGSETHLTNCTHNQFSSLRFCTHYYDVGVECPVPSNVTCTTNGDVRLVGGANQYEGRVEVCYNGQWGTVCDDSWGTYDASVACRQLGYSRVGATAYSYAYFGQGTGGIYLDNLGCRGNELRLIDCNRNPLGVHNCGHNADAGMRCQPRRSGCTDGQIRLNGRSTSREGRVEICVDGTWGTVCDSGWSYSDARVVCRQLGFATIGALARTNAYYGQGSGYVMLTSVGCTGEEPSLLNCTHYGYGVTSCFHYRGAGVRCPGPVNGTVNCTDGDLRLRGGRTSREGRVEICYERQWGTVCDNSWGTNDAKVACRQLGFSSYGASYFFNAYFGRGTGNILLDYVRCTGRESRLLDCSSSGVGVTRYSCGHDDDAGVRCNALGNECRDGSIRLIGSSFSAREGRVEICVEGRWGTICDSSWDSRDAAVVCRQLGYPSLGPIPTINAAYGRGSGPVWLSSLSCNGNETNLLNCSHPGIGITYCGHYDDAGVQCPAAQTVACTTGAVRLVGGTTAREGRVEICYENQWGTVCDDFWSNTDARVVCRQLGYVATGATATSNAFFGRGSGGIFLDNVGCRGTESSLLNCSNSGIGYHNCRHSDDAGVRCLAPTNCIEGQVRLIGGLRQGTVQICLSRLWGTVCDNSWDSRDASVVCRQLGFPVLGAIPFSNAYFGRGTGAILMDRVSCTGREQFLANCTHSGIGITSSSCGHDDDVGVQCPAPVNATVPCNNGAVRLVGGLSSYEGRVEICYNNQWGTVCDNSFTSIDARVVCRQMGLPPIGTAHSNAFFGRGSGGIFLDYVGCRGTESSLLSCTNRGIGIHTCQHSDDVGVRCAVPTNCSQGQIRLRGGSNQREGRVEICISRVWGTICDTQWDYREAQVACRRLGYTALGAVPYVNAYFGRGTGPVLLDRLGCTGSERSLLNCYHRGIGVTSYYCGHDDDVGIRCQVPVNCTDGQIRLRGGTTVREGRVEICISGVWGTICDTFWDSREARVVCRQLGFLSIGAQAFSNARFGRGTGSLLLDRLSCTGNEQSLLNCSHSGIGVTASYCGHDDDAGVRCLAPFVPDNCTESSVRLMFGSTARVGTVQVCINRTWGSICDRSWDSLDAHVVCRQLGFTTLGAIPRLNSYYGRTTGPIWLDYLRCTGSERGILNCTNYGIESVSSSCTHGDDAGVECPVVTISNCTHGSLRLVSGSSSVAVRQGRVELCYNNQWGTVCDDSWGSTDAGVACRQLGFSSYGATAYSYAYFGRGTGPIFLDNLYCTGRESRLVDCTHSGIGVHNCDHSADAGVRCQVPNCFVEGEIRLVRGTTSREGRVEVCLGGMWGTVCDNGWSTVDARVVCRQLGYPTLGARAFSRGYFGRGTGPIVMAYVSCSGRESHLANCSQSASYTRYCSHYEDAGVRCPEFTGAAANCTDGELRLSGGNSSRQGRVEVCYERQWGTVCDDLWGTNDAKVACRQLGFSSLGALARTNAYFGRGTGIILLDNVGCIGGESRLLDCSNFGIGVYSSNCDHGDDAGVTCNERPTECSDGSIRLRGGAVAYQGTVEICVEGTWGTVCDRSWDGSDATVVCRQLGYPYLGAIAYSNARYGSGSGPIWLDYLLCNGSEANLLNCAHRGIGITSSICDHFDDAGVQCPTPATTPVCCDDGEVRLVGGSVAREGRVEICYHNQWGTVCDDLFSSPEAMVICRQLGYSNIAGAVAFSFSHFGAGTGGILLDNLGCSGFESRLLDCSHPTIGIHNCDHNADAGVRCQGTTTITRETRICPTTAALQTTPSPTTPSPNTLSSTSQLISTTTMPSLPIIKQTTQPAPQPTPLPPTPCLTYGVRLINGTNAYEGRVEMCFNNTWGTICDIEWDEQDAQVVCRQLGFSTRRAVALRSAHFGAGRGPILVEGARCIGDEVGLHRCFQTRSQSCSHRNDAAVQCSGPSITPTLIPLVQVSDDLMEGAVVTMVMQSNQRLDRQSMERIINILETYISSYCSGIGQCRRLSETSTDGNQRSARVAGVDVHVVNLTTTDGGRMTISFYVTLFRDPLSADALETLLNEASPLNASLSMAGVTIVRVYRPTVTTPEQSPGSSNLQVVILGVLLGVAGGVILIGALACVIIAWMLYRKRVKQGRAYLQSVRQQQMRAAEHPNAVYEGTEPPSYDPSPFILGTGATAAAISKHQEAYALAQRTEDTASNASSDSDLLIGYGDKAHLSPTQPPPYAAQSGAKP